MIDRELEHRLTNARLFYRVMTKALMKLPLHKANQIMEVMEMRLGHATGYVMKWREIKELTYSLHDNTKTVSMMYCQKLYWRGLRMAEKELHND